MAYRDVLPQGSPFWEKCARHETAQTARAMQSLYLCDTCAERFCKEAMNGRPPIYHGETVKGYCGLCNKLLGVTQRLYFSCPFCWNVLVAYQKAFVACGAVHEFWKQAVTPKFSTLRLTETEVPYLSSYARKGKTKKLAAAELEFLDFIVEEQDHANEFKALFHIELKSGPGSIDEMKEFQLDINDSNDIIGVVQKTELPAYIFHGQLDHEYSPPTRRTIAKGMWFTDIFTLLDNRLSVKARRGEDKDAGYYSPKAFRPIEEFVEELKEKQYENLQKLVADQTLQMT
ncbi:MAG: hypothetical protein ACM3JB_27050 [Acidobacteriaceae bacterium]